MIEKNIALFGFGSGLDLYLNMRTYERDEKIVVIFDNNASLYQGSPDFIVDFPINIELYQFERLFITSRHYINIYKQLLLLGVEEEKIEVFLPMIYTG